MLALAPRHHAKDEETGLVTIDQEQCIGCKSCIQACPYGAPQFVEAKGVTEKCDMCAELRSYGEEPACVAICPQRALKVGDIDELRAEFGDCADGEICAHGRSDGVADSQL